MSPLSSLLTSILHHIPPLFLILSPLTSYTDQILSMHRSRSSAGFSLDIPLIMLTASILKIYYWPGARFDTALLVQAIVMLGVMGVLLKVGLDNREPMEAMRRMGGGGGLEMRSREWNGDRMEKKMESEVPGRWIPAQAHASASLAAGEGRPWKRPFNFWRWPHQPPYWRFLLILTLTLLTLHIFLRPSPGHAGAYTTLLGTLGLSIEALLPLPQLWQNYSTRSCRGFRLSVLGNWLFGDAMKMGFFFLGASGTIPWAFKACGCFQAGCDLGLGVQWWIYGEGEGDGGDVNGHFA